MKTICRNRGKNKTTDCIKLASRGFYHIVCANIKRVEEVDNYAKKLGLHIPLPLTFDEFLGRRYYATGIKGFIIDDVDWMISNMSSVNIIAVSLTRQD